MRQKAFGIVVGVLVAVVSQSAYASITLSATKIADLNGGLQQWQVSAKSNAGEQINTFSFMNLTGSPSLSAPHQIWAPFTAPTGPGTPTKDEHLPGALWNSAWDPYDTYFLFGTADLSLNLGVGWTETNDNSGSAAALGLPNPIAGPFPAQAGFGTLSSLPTGSRVLLPEKQGTDIAFMQVVIKANNPALLDVQVNAPGFPDAVFTDFVVGAAQVPPPVVNSLLLINNTINATVNGTPTATNSPTSWGPAGPTITLASYTPNYGALPGAPGLSQAAQWNPATQLFQWNTTSSTRGDYVWNISATNAGGTGNGTITVEQHAVPEPASLALAGLGMVGLAGLIRRRRG